MKIAFAALLSFALTATAQTMSPPPSPDAPANTGRKALTDYLNSVGYQETAARREVIAKITTREQAEARQKEVRAKILALIGGTLPERVPLNARITGSSTLEDGIRVDKVIFDSQPDFPITALLYTPSTLGITEGDTATRKFPAIVMAPGHSPAGKSGDVAMATAFAKAGFIVLSYDPIGQGERLQYLDPSSPEDKATSLAARPTGEHGEAGLQPTLIGDALARYFLWDGMRAVDYLESLPSVDRARIGAFGCSGGGTMTALLTALDPRIAVAGVACYTTSFDALLPSATGVQDSEQSTPDFIAAGLDFPDWSELHAPRPYAMIATTSDMFPFDGVKTTFAEAQHFYGLFGAADSLALIDGPGGHGNLKPITPQILHFFADHLHPDAAYAAALPPITDPFDEKANPPRRPGQGGGFPPPPPASLVQVTPTGQLSSSYPGVATVFTLNKARAAKVVTPQVKSLAEAQQAVREVTHAETKPGGPPAGFLKAFNKDGMTLGFLEPDNIDLTAEFTTPVDGSGKRPAVLVLLENIDKTTFAAESSRATTDCKTCVVFAFTPRPSPPGSEETKAPILGSFYLTELRAELVGKTLLGMRVEDIIHAVDNLARRPDVDPSNITAVASGHLGLVLLHAAILDPRLKHVTITGALASYRALMQVPLPADEPQDELPGVLRHYDIPDLVRLLGPRVTFVDPKKGAEAPAKK